MVIFQCKRGALYISVHVCVYIRDNIFYNFLFLKFIYLLTYYFVEESYFVSQLCVSVKGSEDNFRGFTSLLQPCDYSQIIQFRGKHFYWAISRF